MEKRRFLGSVFLGRAFLVRTLAAVAVLTSASCSEAPKPAAETKAEEASGPAKLVTGKTAFWEMYKSAHSWAKDKVALSLESKVVPGYKSEGGKAAQWKGIFGSPSLHQAVTFTYTVAAIPPDISKGVSVGRAIPWSGPQREGMPFDTGEFKVDSDAAFKTAFEGAKDWVGKHPDEDFSMSLGNASRFPGPVWSFLWGTHKSGYFALVSAMTGKLEKQGK